MKRKLIKLRKTIDKGKVMWLMDHIDAIEFITLKTDYKKTSELITLLFLDILIESL